MIPASDRYRQARAESHKSIATLEVIRRGVTAGWAQVVDGQFDADRTRPARYSCSLQLDPSTKIGRDALSPYGTRVRLWCGIDFAGDWDPEVNRGTDFELLPCGTYRVTALRTALPKDRISLTGVGLEAFCIGDEFFTPGYYPGGTAQDGLTRFISESIPGQAYLDFRVPDVKVAEASWDNERWGGEDAACQMLARAMGAEVYADAMGRFVVRPTPGLGDAVSGEFLAGEGGTLLGFSREYSRDGVSNLVVVSSSASLPDDVVLRPQMAWDADPYSPTFLGADPFATPDESGFGREVLHQTTPLATSEDGLMAVAQSLLADSRGLVARSDGSALADFTLEAGDVRTVTTDLGQERQVVDSLTCPVQGGAMSLGLRSTRIFP